MRTLNVMGMVMSGQTVGQTRRSPHSSHLQPPLLIRRCRRRPMPAARGQPGKGRGAATGVTSCRTTPCGGCTPATNIERHPSVASANCSHDGHVRFMYVAPLQLFLRLGRHDAMPSSHPRPQNALQTGKVPPRLNALLNCCCIMLL